MKTTQQSARPPEFKVSKSTVHKDVTERLCLNLHWQMRPSP
ncbi:MAG: sporulation transcriptional regulator SpoIIID [Blautia coccoides]